MKLAFSTLGCPDWDWNEIYSIAKDLKFDGIEVRGVANELFVPKIKAFNQEHIEKTIAKMKSCELEFSMLTSGISIGEDNKTALEDAKSYIDLASKLSAKYIRIMISSHPQPEDVNMENAIKLYNDMCQYGESRGVIPLIETNGILANSKEMLEFMEAIESENKGVLWDIHHPFRYFGEQPQETHSNIGKYVKYIHVKDSIMLGESLAYRMMGYGDVPIFDALKILKENGYDGYVSLEWVKRWNPDLEGAGIVFAHFMSYITFLMGRLYS
ncbi:MAG: sugar phosphate isomerase/epimerase family protein [Oscillospiraceae bacterium]